MYVKKQIVFITIFLMIAVSSLWPNFGYALPVQQAGFFTEPFTAFASSFIKIGSTLDQTISVSVDAITNTQDTITKQIQNAKIQITKTHQVLRRTTTAGWRTGKHLVWEISAQIKNTAQQTLNGVSDSFGSIWNGDPGLGIVSSIANLKFLSRAADTAVEPEEGFDSLIGESRDTPRVSAKLKFGPSYAKIDASSNNAVQQSASAERERELPQV